MSVAAEPLVARVRRGDPLRVLLVKMPAPTEIEQAADTGFDAVIIDTEHGPASGLELEHHLRAADAARIAALVRVPTSDAGPILAALDAGATGIVVAHVADPACAAAVVDAAHYPPRGHRGLALTTRAGRFGTAALAAHLARAARETLVFVQIEDAQAVRRTQEILSVDGVDGVLIGATDLSISLGQPGESGSREVRAAIDEIIAAGARAGKAVAKVVTRPTEASQTPGVTIAVFVATLLIRDALRAAAGPRASVDPAPRSRPLVLLPGMLETAEVWDDVAPALAELTSVHIARIDLDDTVEEMADSVLATASDRFALAGHSLGAIVALTVARKAPARVTRLALLNANPRSPSDAQLAEWAETETRVRDGDFTVVAEEFARANLPEFRRDDADLVGRIETMALQVGARGLLRQLAAQRARPDLRPFLAHVTCPTLVVAGDADHICPPSLQEEIAAAIPGARLERLSRCGHMSTLEMPERVGPLIAQLLV
ncbi:MAG: alpha/beta fold hydrolase [Solirubrobacterales bacterium]|nr:alpha/beta fold hydrolase [Solirubrobacterales bacterium]